MSFRLIFEVAVPREPEIKKVIRQLEIFSGVVDTFLVPDNHLGLAALSSVALAIEVRNQGFKPLVALNARDRNLRRLKSDLLTLQAYGIDEVLLVYGDSVDEDRSGLTVRRMLKEAGDMGLRAGVAASVGRPLGWRTRADFLVTQLAFGRSSAGYWREAHGFRQPVYCGVVGLPNADLARRYLGNIPGLDLPEGYLDAFEADGEAGLKAAIQELSDLKRSGIDGAHLVVPAEWRRFSDLLGAWKEDL